MHADLVESTAEVELGEESSADQFVKELVNHRHWKFVLDGVVVELPIVDAESPGAVGFLDKEDRRREW